MLNKYIETIKPSVLRVQTAMGSAKVELRATDGELVMIDSAANLIVFRFDIRHCLQSAASRKVAEEAVPISAINEAFLVFENAH